MNTKSLGHVNKIIELPLALASLKGDCCLRTCDMVQVILKGDI